MVSAASPSLSYESYPYFSLYFRTDDTGASFFSDAIHSFGKAVERPAIFHTAEKPASEMLRSVGSHPPVKPGVGHVDSTEKVLSAAIGIAAKYRPPWISVSAVKENPFLQYSAGKL